MWETKKVKVVLPCRTLKYADGFERFKLDDGSLGGYDYSRPIYRERIVEPERDGAVFVAECDVGGLSDVCLLKPKALNEDALDSLQSDLQTASDAEIVATRGGIRSLREAADKLDQGWPEGADRALALAEGLEDLVEDPISRKRQLRWRDNGDELDADRMMGGQLDSAWRSTERQVRVGTNTVLTVAVSWGINGSIPADQLFWSGAVAVALTDLLETAGYSIDLWAIDSVAWWSDDRFAVTAIDVKGPGEILRSDAVAALLSHPGIYRTLGLAATAQAPWRIGNGFGSAVDIEEILQMCIDHGVVEHPDIVIPKLRNEQQAIAFLRKTIEDVNRAAVYALGSDEKEAGAVL